MERRQEETSFLNHSHLNKNDDESRPSEGRRTVGKSRGGTEVGWDDEVREQALGVISSLQERQAQHRSIVRDLESKLTQVLCVLSYC